MWILIWLLLWTKNIYAEELYIPLGESRSLKATAGETVRVSRSGIVNVRDQGNSIQVLAVKTGSAQIKFGGKSIDVFVIGRRHLRFFNELTQLVRTFRGLKAELIDGHVTVTGRLLRVSDWQAIADLSEESGSSYSFRARPDDDIKENLLQTIKDKLSDKNLPPPLIFWTPHARAIIAEEHKTLDSLWQEVFRPYGIDIVYEKSQLATETLVRVKIVVAEINRKLQSEMGVSWPESVTAQIAPKLSMPGKIELFLKAMEKKGLGQILASPSLLARSGAEAEFLAGGEIPLKLVGRGHYEVVWKKHGIFLKIKPRADRSGRLSVELTTEVSLIDGANMIDGLPGLKTNRMTTHFDLNQSRTIVLSGLIRSDWGRESGGLPYLSQLPVIGKLFGSENFYNLKTELVVFVTPEIVSEYDDATAKMPVGWEDKIANF